MSEEREPISTDPALSHPAPLSEGAQEAVSWLFSADAAPLTARQAQHYIRERWGEAVEEELRDFGARPTS
jgi:hypothetical protein